MITKRQRRLRADLQEIEDAAATIRRHLIGLPADNLLDLDVVRDAFMACYNAAEAGLRVVDEMWAVPPDCYTAHGTASEESQR